MFAGDFVDVFREKRFQNGGKVSEEWVNQKKREISGRNRKGEL